MREITLHGGLGGLSRRSTSSESEPEDRQPAAAPGELSGGAEGVPVVVLRDQPEATAERAPSPVVAEAAQLVGGTEPNTSQGRDILVQYDGTFVGVYHAPRKITNRTAYRTIAAMVRNEWCDFDPEKLALYRPVALEAPPRDEIMSGEDIGRFTRFDRPGEAEAIG